MAAWCGGNGMKVKVNTKSFISADSNNKYNIPNLLNKNKQMVIIVDEQEEEEIFGIADRRKPCLTLCSSSV